MGVLVPPSRAVSVIGIVRAAFIFDDCVGRGAAVRRLPANAVPRDDLRLLLQLLYIVLISSGWCIFAHLQHAVLIKSGWCIFAHLQQHAASAAYSRNMPVDGVAPRRIASLASKANAVLSWSYGRFKFVGLYSDGAGQLVVILGVCRTVLRRRWPAAGGYRREEIYITTRSFVARESFLQQYGYGWPPLYVTSRSRF